MTELLNNQDYRKEALKEIIRELHRGKSVEEVKARFNELIKDVAPAEISLMEQALINEGLPVEEVQRLCDVHAAVFKDSLERAPQPETIPGHPVHTFKEENRALEDLMIREIQPLLAELRRANPDVEKDLAIKLAEKLNLLQDVNKHYSRKENLLFPYLEKYQIVGPPKVMWGVDDEIRDLLKEARDLAVNYVPDKKEELITRTEAALAKIKEMIFKEERILFPMALETLTEDEWYRIMLDSASIGYCLIEPREDWRPAQVKLDQKETVASEETRGYIKFATGILTPREISLIFDHLPVDITFVDKDNVVKYFSNTRERIFTRSRAVIGRRVENCHPPASVQVVEKLIADFKSGRKDREAFWLHLGDKYVFIQYFAVRDEKGDFAGTLEVTMDFKPLQAISGEKRIMD
ncbi:DUF438 domain-containing protein [Neomoorella thermoacetica]|uniref:DUF438 domain-containing protein n=1 Tax=Neomoorella thermoacetica TaxID=1525 RepID=UPI0008F9FB43|nr:DUF438 domain-containing protein [Moorella thermoacetica]OIQ12331.1 hemerythrin HHE cation binding domain protein [Moorella thermoacetica]